MATEITASNGTVHGAKEMLVRDLKRVVGDADDLLTELAHASAGEVASARSKIETRLSEAGSRIDDARILLGKKASGAADASQAYARENPWTVFGVAAAAGLVAAYLFSRR